MANYCWVYGVIHFTSPAGWLPVHRDQLRAQRSVTSMGKLCLYLTVGWCGSGAESVVWEDNGIGCWWATSAAYGSRRRGARDWEGLQQVCLCCVSALFLSVSPLCPRPVMCLWYLLRMGHSEEELETEKDYSRSVCVVSQLSLSRLYIGTYHNVISTLRHRLYTNFAPHVLSCRIQEPVGSPFFAEKWP